MNLQKKFYYRQRQADRNRAKVLERLEKRKQKGGTDRRTNSTKNPPQLSQEECLENLRKFSNYTLQVLSFTDAGDGQLSKIISCATHSDGKIFYTS